MAYVALQGYPIALIVITGGGTVTNSLSFLPMPNAIVVNGNQVIISGPAGASLYYTMTTDGSTPANPTTGSTLYTAPIPLSVNGTTVIRAISVLAGDTSASVSATYAVAPNISGTNGAAKGAVKSRVFNPPN